LLGKPEIGDPRRTCARSPGCARAIGTLTVRRAGRCGSTRVRPGVRMLARRGVRSGLMSRRARGGGRCGDAGDDLDRSAGRDRGLVRGAARRPTKRGRQPRSRRPARCVRRRSRRPLATPCRRSAQLDARHKSEQELLKDLTAPIRGCATTPSACWRSAQPGCRSAADSPAAGSTRKFPRAAGALIAIGIAGRSRAHRHDPAPPVEDVGPILYAIASLGGPRPRRSLHARERRPGRETRRRPRAPTKT